MTPSGIILYSVGNAKNPRRKANGTMTMLTDSTTEVEVEVAAPSIPDSIIANARELDDLRSAAKVIKEREAALRAGILDYLDSQATDAVTDGTVTISKSSHERKGIDRDKMEALYPKVLEAVTTTTDVVQVRVKIKG